MIRRLHEDYTRITDGLLDSFRDDMVNIAQNSRDVSKECSDFMRTDLYSAFQKGDISEINLAEANDSINAIGDLFNEIFKEFSNLRNSLR